MCPTELSSRCGVLGCTSTPGAHHCPLTFLLNSFHQLHQERRSNLGRAELLLQIWERRPWGRGRERRAQYQLSPQQQSWARAQPRQLPTGARKAVAPTVRLCPRQTQHGACKEPAQEPAQHLLSSSPVCTGRYLLLRAEAWRQSPSPWGPVPPGQAAQGLPGLLELRAGSLPSTGTVQGWQQSRARELALLRGEL